MSVPNGFQEIVKAYGDPRAFLGEDGVMGGLEMAAWEAHLKLVSLKLPAPLQLSWGKPGQVVRLIRCHPVAADSFNHMFSTVHNEGLWPDLHTYGGCFAPRMQRGSVDKWSTHTWALGIDVDVLRNPFGAEPKMSLAIVQIAEACGLTWGGRWRTPDGMHLQTGLTGY